MTTDDMFIDTDGTAVRAGPRPGPPECRDTDRAERGWTSPELASAETGLRRLGSCDCLHERDAVEEMLASTTAELLAADEEIRAQRDALDALEEDAEVTARRRWRVSAMLPVPVLSTDRASRIVTANPAAAVRLNVPTTTLGGKPLLAFVHPEDRREVRSLLDAATEEPSRLGVRLAPRQGEPVPVDVVVTAERMPGLLTWTVLDAGRADGDTALARALAEVCGLAGSTDSRHDVLAALARSALFGVHGAESTGLSLGPSDAPTAVGYAGDLAARLDAHQLRAGEGPAVLAERTDEAVLSDDLLTDPRWPRLARLGTGVGARSIFVVPVRADGEQVGLFTCCAPGVRAFGPGHRDAAATLAAAAGSVLAGMFRRDRLAELAENLDRALVSRQEIDEAKGIVIAQRGCTPEEAFAHLAELSQRENVKLRVIAHRIVAQAALPDDPVLAGKPWVSRRRS